MCSHCGQKCDCKKVMCSKCHEKCTENKTENNFKPNDNWNMISLLKSINKIINTRDKNVKNVIIR
jgi:hypothetical protein